MTVPSFRLSQRLSLNSSRVLLMKTMTLMIDWWRCVLKKSRSYITITRLVEEMLIVTPSQSTLIPQFRGIDKQICTSPEPGRSSKLTHTDAGIDLCASQTGCQLSSAASGMSLGFVFFSGMKQMCPTAGSWWCCLSRYGGCEFDPRLVHDTLSVPLWVYMRFAAQDHQNQTNEYVSLWI